MKLITFCSVILSIAFANGDAIALAGVLVKASTTQEVTSGVHFTDENHNTLSISQQSADALLVQADVTIEGDLDAKDLTVENLTVENVTVGASSLTELLQMARPCPENSQGSSVYDGCTCNAGFAGNVTASPSAPFFEGECVSLCPVAGLGLSYFLAEHHRFNARENSVVTLPVLEISGGQAFSFAGWFKMHSFPGSYSRIFDLHTDIRLHPNGATTMRFSSDGTTLDVADFWAADDTSWVHIAVTLDSSGNRVMYKYGVEVGSISGDPLSPLVLEWNYIGKSNWGATESADSYEALADMTTFNYMWFDSVISQDCINYHYSVSP